MNQAVDNPGGERRNPAMGQTPTPLAYANRAACPHCGSQDWAPVSFTWWGGVLGPKLMHHVKCARCRKTFNSKTGKSNTTAIWIYQGVALAIGFAIGLIFFVLR